jgi:hypothetical protein
MKDKYLGKDGITEKYDFRCKYIRGSQILGVGLGGIYSLFPIAHNFMSSENDSIKDIRNMGVGVLIGVCSYLIGDYIHKRNESKREKALKNLELRMEGRR